MRNIYLGTYLGVGAYRSPSKNGYLGAYPGVGACPGDYGMYMFEHEGNRCERTREREREIGVWSDGTVR